MSAFKGPLVSSHSHLFLPSIFTTIHISHHIYFPPSIFPTNYISHHRDSIEHLHLHQNNHQAGPWHPGNGGGLGSNGRPRRSPPLFHPPSCHCPRLDQVDVIVILTTPIILIFMTIFAREECISEPGASPPTSDQLCAGLSHARCS